MRGAVQSPFHFCQPADRDRQTPCPVVEYPTSTLLYPSPQLSAAYSRVRVAHCEGALSPARGCPFGSTLGSRTIGGGGPTVLVRVRPIRTRRPHFQHHSGAKGMRYGQNQWARMVLAFVPAVF